MMNRPRPRDCALVTCVAVAAVAAFLALAAMLSQLSYAPERPPEEYVPIRLVPLE
ncbi:cytochrome c-type biogenesis protein CcmE [Bradyrhizobium sp. GM0.4]